MFLYLDLRQGTVSLRARCCMLALPVFCVFSFAVTVRCSAMCVACFSNGYVLRASQVGACGCCIGLGDGRWAEVDCGCVRDMGCGHKRGKWQKRLWRRVGRVGRRERERSIGFRNLEGS